ncbi:hypothetical protein QE152_g36249 [Popillia japonica]|uniref:Uncharacterized protein n=1 Tax=Popillia japonica TaxID=7064 RepID=A0AAW1IDQ2_POPJA
MKKESCSMVIIVRTTGDHSENDITTIPLLLIPRNQFQETRNDSYVHTTRPKAALIQLTNYEPPVTVPKTFGDGHDDTIATDSKKPEMIVMYIQQDQRRH